MRSLLPLLFGSLLACRGPRPDVVVVVVDTLRWDALSMNGAAHPATPVLDALAQESRTFDRGYASSSWTLASTASLLTGRHAVNHGVIDPVKRLPEAADTLAEVLADRGYATTSVVSNPLVASAPSMLAGFTDRHAIVDDEGTTADALTAAALEALDPARPDFVYLHYMDPHYPYLNHPHLDWAPPEGVGRLKGGESIAMLREMTLTPEELAFVKACYAEEVHVADRAIGRLLAGLDDDTLLMVTSDHGEEFLERGWLGHVRTVHEELVHVPLMVRGPGMTPGRVDAPTLNSGFFATVTEVLDIRTPRAVQVPDLLGPPEPGVLVEVDFEPQSIKYSAKAAHKQAWLTGHTKLLRDLDAGTVTRFDLAADPHERAGVPVTDPAALQPLVDAHAAAADGALDHEQKSADQRAREMLEALGYLD